MKTVFHQALDAFISKLTSELRSPLFCCLYLCGETSFIDSTERVDLTDMLQNAVQVSSLLRTIESSRAAADADILAPFGKAPVDDGFDTWVAELPGRLSAIHTTTSNRSERDLVNEVNVLAKKFASCSCSRRPPKSFEKALDNADNVIQSVNTEEKKLLANSSNI